MLRSAIKFVIAEVVPSIAAPESSYASRHASLDHVQLVIPDGVWAAKDMESYPLYFSWQSSSILCSNFELL